MATIKPASGDLPLSAAIFDVDGTLVDSNDLHVEAWREAFAHYGIALGYDEVHAQIGKGGDQLIPVFCTEEQVDKFGAELDKLRGEIFLCDYLPQVRPFPRVRELFERLRGDGFQIALASSATEGELERHIASLNIDGLLDGATSRDNAEHSKPCPDIFEAALARLSGVFAEEAIVVGDSPYDAIAARRCGMRTIGLLSGGFGADELREAGAIEIYVDAADLLERYDESVLGRCAVGA